MTFVFENLLRAMIFGIPGAVLLVKAAKKHTELSYKSFDPVTPIMMLQYIVGGVFSFCGFIFFLGIFVAENA